MLRKTWPLLLCIYFLVACVSNHGGITCEDLEITPPPPPETTPCENIPSDNWKSLGLENETISALAVHPDYEGLILAGTNINFSEQEIGKLFKSTDCGKSWELVFEGGSFSEIQFHPTNPAIIYAANDRVLKSTDYGDSWELSDTGIELNAETYAVDISIDPQNSCVMFTGTTGFFGGGLYRSVDSGKNWEKLDGAGLDNRRLENGISGVEVDKTNSRYIYAGVAAIGGLVRSGNRGDSWGITDLTNVGKAVFAIESDPNNSHLVYSSLSRGGLYFSLDRGKDWHLIDNQYIGSSTNIIELELNHENSNLYIVVTEENNSFIYRFNSNENSWSEIESPTPGQETYFGQVESKSNQGNTYLYFGSMGLHVRAEN